MSVTCEYDLGQQVRIIGTAANDTKEFDLSQILGIPKSHLQLTEVMLKNGLWKGLASFYWDNNIARTNILGFQVNKDEKREQDVLQIAMDPTTGINSQLSVVTFSLVWRPNPK